MALSHWIIVYDNVLYHTFTFYSVKKNNDLYESVPIIVDTDYQVSYTSYTYNMYDGGVMVSLRLGKKLEDRLDSLPNGQAGPRPITSDSC